MKDLLDPFPAMVNDAAQAPGGQPPTRDRPRVFISYSHDSEAHRTSVLKLADRLRADGVEAWIDRYDPSPSQGWPRWMLQQLKQADIVLYVCTETFRRRFEGEEEPGLGKGASWEGLLAMQMLYDPRLRATTKFYAIAIEPGSLDSVPLVLQQFNSFQLPDEYDKLYEVLTGLDRVEVPPVGKVRVLAPESEGLPDLSRDAAARAELERRVRLIRLQRGWLPKLAAVTVSAFVAWAVVQELIPPAPRPFVNLGVTAKDAIVLRNEGEASAKFKKSSFAVWVDGEAVGSWQQFLEQLGIYQEVEYAWPEFLPAGKRKSILKVHGLDGGLIFYASRMAFEYCYCSGRNDCWVVTGKPGALETREAKCPKGPRFALP